MGIGKRHFDAQVNTSFFKKVEREENEQRSEFDMTNICGLGSDMKDSIFALITFLMEMLK